ncbi:GLPGLI family protein [Flavobacterium aureirubrum]|uniref:GLPGLI family protein n=1 Tax=Flavobacterium aureirubrum TaxID=3133147 RepID=UPI003183E980
MKKNKSKNLIKIIVTCVFTFFSVSFLFSQNTKVTYRVTINEYSNYSSTATDDLFKASEFAANFTTFHLIYNNNEMFFFAKKMENLSDEEFENLLLICDINGSYYRQTKNDFLYRIVAEKNLIKNLTCKSKVITNWKLSSEKKIILGYECERADSMVYIDYGNGESNGTYKITAWYCKDFKSIFGPKGFGNLNGLILELNQNLVTYTATNIEESFEEFPFKMTPDLKIIDEKDFFIYFQKLRNKD